MILTFEIKDEDEANTMINAFCSGGNYQEFIDMIDDATKETSQIPNPILKPQFAKNAWIQLGKDYVKRQIQIEDEPIFNIALAAKKEAIDQIDIT